MAMNAEAPRMQSEGGETEKIVSAAIEYQGKRYMAAAHGIAYGDLLEENPDSDLVGVREGFITSTGRFVGRAEAAEIARGQGQTVAEQQGPLDSQDLLKAA